MKKDSEAREITFVEAQRASQERTKKENHTEDVGALTLRAAMMFGTRRRVVISMYLCVYVTQAKLGLSQARQDGGG